MLRRKKRPADMILQEDGFPARLGNGRCGEIANEAEAIEIRAAVEEWPVFGKDIFKIATPEGVVNHFARELVRVIANPGYDFGWVTGRGEVRDESRRAPRDGGLGHDESHTHDGSDDDGAAGGTVVGGDS